MNNNWIPHITVATIIEKENKFLMVEEDLHGKKLLNQPAGHLDKGETLIQAAVRETQEESGWQVEIKHMIELAQWTSPNSDTHFLRACFAGKAIKHFPDQKLDDGIIRALWMTREEVKQNFHRLRSPLVLNHIDHYIAGKKFDLDFLVIMTNKNKVIVGMSGGVDSSVSVALLQEQGYFVEGMFMKNWEEDDTNDVCSATIDAQDAQSVADRLNVKLHLRNFASEYWDFVFEDFLNEYKIGRTPNPDILCNREIKFKTFLENAKDLNADYMATGHYVDKDYLDGKHRLLKGQDNNKDQSYFLYTITQEQLAYSLFPLGKIAKPKVRELAQQLELNVADKKDSVGICFIGEKDFQKFLTTYIKPNPGKIVDDKGKVIGKHTGLMYYTIGQRQGLGIGGVKDAPPLPWFVVAKNHQDNELIAIQGGDHPLLQSNELLSDQLNWISGEEPHFPFTCKAKTRYRQTDQDCTVYYDKEDSIRVEFNHQQRAVTPGQSVVFYQDNVCLGGGIIQHTNTLTNQCELRENNEK